MIGECEECLTLFEKQEPWHVLCRTCQAEKEIRDEDD